VLVFLHLIAALPNVGASWVQPSELLKLLVFTEMGQPWSVSSYLHELFWLILFIQGMDPAQVEYRRRIW